MDELDHLRGQLESVSERLGDRIMDLLQEAVLTGADRRPQTERLLSRARNAVDKAVSLIDQASHAQHAEEHGE